MSVAARNPAHRASVRCTVPPRQAFDFLADARQLGRWALGSWQAALIGDGIACGRSIFDDTLSYVRPVADADRMTVTYHVGRAPDALSPRILARVEALSPDEGTGCLVSLEGERAFDMDDARWLRLMRSHELEVLLIDALLTRAATSKTIPETARLETSR